MFSNLHQLWSGFCSEPFGHSHPLKAKPMSIFWLSLNPNLQVFPIWSSVWTIPPDLSQPSLHQYSFPWSYHLLFPLSTFTLKPTPACRGTLKSSRHLTQILLIYNYSTLRLYTDIKILPCLISFIAVVTEDSGPCQQCPVRTASTRLEDTDLNQ